MTLRPYQQKTIDDLYSYLAHSAGDPVVVLPTGSGKSVIIAAICADALQNWPETRILMLTHVKELISQNYRELKQWWPNAPAGIYSAGLNRKDIHELIIFGGIQSLRSKAREIGYVDLLIIDESHTVSHKDEGSYRKLIDALRIINPALRVIGLTATPYRLGHGMITSGGALFDDILEPCTIELLVYGGYLVKPISRATDLKLSTEGVHKRGGEYIERELQAAVDIDEKTQEVATEIIKLGEDRKAWLVFCTGVDHSYHMRDALRLHGVTAETITGETPKKERDELIESYKLGEIRALTNANVLTTGFNYPGIDMIALCRPTMSPGLYVQMVGRGMRPAPGKENCLVLDFAGVVEAHGPITDITPPRKPGEPTGEPPIKLCPECNFFSHLSAKICDTCGYEFPVRGKSDDLRLRDDNVYEETIRELEVDAWHWIEYTGKSSGKKMLRVTYYSAEISQKPIHEYLVIWHEGFAGRKAVSTLKEIATNTGVDLTDVGTTNQLCRELTASYPPWKILYKMEGKYPRVVSREWSEAIDYSDAVPF